MNRMNRKSLVEVVGALWTGGAALYATIQVPFRASHPGLDQVITISPGDGRLFLCGELTAENVDLMKPAVREVDGMKPNEHITFYPEEIFHMLRDRQKVVVCGYTSSLRTERGFFAVLWYEERHTERGAIFGGKIEVYKPV